VVSSGQPGNTPIYFRDRLRRHWDSKESRSKVFAADAVERAGSANTSVTDLLANDRHGAVVGEFDHGLSLMFVDDSEHVPSRCSCRANTNSS
jgi:hypothetical protein